MKLFKNHKLEEFKQREFSLNDSYNRNALSDAEKDIVDILSKKSVTKGLELIKHYEELIKDINNDLSDKDQDSHFLENQVSGRLQQAGANSLSILFASLSASAVNLFSHVALMFYRTYQQNIKNDLPDILDKLVRKNVVAEAPKINPVAESEFKYVS